MEDIPATAEGRVDLEALKARLGPDVAAVMITNPNTCGLFERDMKAISDAVHAAADLRVRVPMAPGRRSLNVVTALAMVLGEALRQTGGFAPDVGAPPGAP